MGLDLHLKTVTYNALLISFMSWDLQVFPLKNRVTHSNKFQIKYSVSLKLLIWNKFTVNHKLFDKMLVKLCEDCSKKDSAGLGRSRLSNFMKVHKNKIFKTHAKVSTSRRKAYTNPKYIYSSKNKDLNRFLKYFRSSFQGSSDINVNELESTSKFLQKWKQKVYRSLRL